MTEKGLLTRLSRSYTKHQARRLVALFLLDGLLVFIDLDSYIIAWWMGLCNSGLRVGSV